MRALLERQAGGGVIQQDNSTLARHSTTR